MNLNKIWVLRIGLLFILFIFGPPLLFADNCSAPSDCFPTLTAAAVAAAAAGAFAGGLVVDLYRDWRRSQHPTEDEMLEDSANASVAD